MKESEHQHAERGDQEVDPSARFLDQEQAVAREISLSRLKREACSGDDANQPRDRGQDPPQVVRTGGGVVSLQNPRNQHGTGDHEDLHLHATPRDRRPSSLLGAP
jgi:hypothetical protein